MEVRKIPLVTLVRARFQLLKALAGKVKEYQAKDSQSNYQTMLFGKATTAQTTYDYSFQFDPKSYPTNSFYQGRYRFNKHYYGDMIGAFDSEDEFFCAQVIDQCPEVKTWVRNLVHESWGFHLPLSNGHFFYPDFVAMLNDGRIFVVEYKGAHLIEGAQEKKNIGELWEEKSKGKALFLMAVESDAQRWDVYKQIEDKVKK
jgi:type III restriction enzyme